jgi:hypothetical protein
MFFGGKHAPFVSCECEGSPPTAPLPSESFPLALAPTDGDRLFLG